MPPFPASSLLGLGDCTMQIRGPLYHYTKPLFFNFFVKLIFMHTHTCYRTCVVVRGQLVGVGSLSLCRSEGPNSGRHA